MERAHLGVGCVGALALSFFTAHHAHAAIVVGVRNDLGVYSRAIRGHALKQLLFVELTQRGFDVRDGNAHHAGRPHLIVALRSLGHPRAVEIAIEHQGCSPEHQAEAPHARVVARGRMKPTLFRRSIALLAASLAQGVARRPAAPQRLGPAMPAPLPTPAHHTREATGAPRAVPSVPSTAVHAERAPIPALSLRPREEAVDAEALGYAAGAHDGTPLLLASVPTTLLRVRAPKPEPPPRVTTLEVSLGAAAAWRSAAPMAQGRLAIRFSPFSPSGALGVVAVVDGGGTSTSTVSVNDWRVLAGLTYRLSIASWLDFDAGALAGLGIHRFELANPTLREAVGARYGWAGSVLGSLTLWPWRARRLGLELRAGLSLQSGREHVSGGQSLWHTEPVGGEIGLGVVVRLR